MKGMTQSQIPFRETKQMFNSSKKQFHSHTGSDLHAYATEKQSIRQNSTKSSSSYRLTGFPAISKRSKHSAISKCFFLIRASVTQKKDPETTSNMDTSISKNFQVSNFRNDLQRKSEVMLSFPIASTQFQQFCKNLSDKELFLCRDLLEKKSMASRNSVLKGLRARD